MMKRNGIHCLLIVYMYATVHSLMLKHNVKPKVFLFTCHLDCFLDSNLIKSCFLAVYNVMIMTSVVTAMLYL